MTVSFLSLSHTHAHAHTLSHTPPPHTSPPPPPPGPDFKTTMIDRGVLPTLFTLARSLDVTSQRYATLAMLNLSMGSGDDKSHIIDAGAVRPLMFLARFPDMEIQR